LNKDEITKRFRQVSDSVEAMSKQQEQDISAKVNAIGENAIKKLNGLL
jgi:hypothetical protein